MRFYEEIWCGDGRGCWYFEYDWGPKPSLTPLSERQPTDAGRPRAPAKPSDGVIPSDSAPDSGGNEYSAKECDSEDDKPGDLGF